MASRFCVFCINVRLTLSLVQFIVVSSFGLFLVIHYFSAAWRRSCLGVGLATPKVAGSTPGLALSGNNPGQVVHTRAPLSPSSIIWYRSMDGDAVRLGR